MLYRALLLALATAHAWNDCAFPDVGYFALDEGVGISHNYASAAMNGNVYMGGYTKGNFALVGVTDGPDVNPEPAAAQWGDTTSDVVVRMAPRTLLNLHALPLTTRDLFSALAHLNRQSIYLAEVSTTGKMTKSWRFQGSALQVATVSISDTNGVYAGGVRAMLSKQHLAVLAHFRQEFTLPDGTQWSSALHTDGSDRLNTDDHTPFVMKLDVSSTNGVGDGTTGWARVMDEDHLGVTIHPGGVSIHSVDGDANGDMIVSYTGYSGYNATSGEKTGGVHYLTKLGDGGAEMWKVVVPEGLSNCRAINDGHFFCGYTMSSSDSAVDFNNGVVVPAAPADMGSRDTKAVVVKFDGLGVAQWAKHSSSHGVSFGRMAVSADGTVLVLTSGGVTSRMDTSPGTEGTIMWTDSNAGAGGHSGYRGLEVTGDGAEVVVHGSVSGSGAVKLVDSANSEIELRTRGSMEVFVAAFDGTTGQGKWAVDGGGTGMEYMFSMAVDPDTHDIYVGGTSRCERASCT